MVLRLNISAMCAPLQLTRDLLLRWPRLGWIGSQIKGARVEMGSASGMAGMETGTVIGVMRINVVMFGSHSKVVMGAAVVTSRNKMIKICISLVILLESLSQVIIRGVSVLGRHKRCVM
jgi:hypothetical protein